MRSHWIFAVGAAVGVLAMAMPRLATRLQGAHTAQHQAGPLAHEEHKFEFTANGPMETVAPLFGADRERVWSPDWNPEFVYPTTPSDVRGMVFKVKHGNLNAIWVNTEFDLKSGRFQYAYLIPDALVTLITIQLTPHGNVTQVAVGYDRTALSTDANAHVRHLAENDAKASPEWETQINDYLAKTKQSARPMSEHVAPLAER